MVMERLITVHTSLDKQPSIVEYQSKLFLQNIQLNRQ
jgi:hypothetical protein